MTAGAAIAAYVFAQQSGLAKPKRRAATTTATAAAAGPTTWDTQIYKPSAVSKAVGGSKKAAKTPKQQ